HDSAHRSDALTLEFKQRVAGDRQTEPRELGQRTVTCADRQIRQREDRRTAPLARRHRASAGAQRALGPLGGALLTVLAAHTRRFQVTSPHFKFEARATPNTRACRVTDQRGNRLAAVPGEPGAEVRRRTALRPRGSPPRSSGAPRACCKAKRASGTPPRDGPGFAVAGSRGRNRSHRWWLGTGHDGA